MILDDHNRQTKKINIVGQYEKEEFSNRAFCILAHCDTEDKLKQLDLKIDKIRKSFNVEIYLFSHIFVPEFIMNKVDYFVFNKNNPIHNVELFTDAYSSITFSIRYENLKVRRAMFYHGYAHYLQIYDALSLLKNQNVNYAYVMNYDVPDDITDNIEEYQFKLLSKDLVHFNYDDDNDGDSMSTEVFFCRVNPVFNRIKNSLSLTNYEKNGIMHTGSLETVFKKLLEGLNCHNLGNYKNTQGKAYIGNHNFDFYDKNNISILHSNIDDLIIIPHAFDHKNRVISFVNCITPFLKYKTVKLFFCNYKKEILKTEEFNIAPTQRKHISFSSEFELLKFDIDNKHQFTIDLNEKNNYGYYSAN